MAGCENGNREKRRRAEGGRPARTMGSQWYKAHMRGWARWGKW